MAASHFIKIVDATAVNSFGVDIDKHKLFSFLIGGTLMR